ncbi:MAG: hypothetical protein R3D85_17765 [Paracoccaceae bacterium]
MRFSNLPTLATGLALAVSATTATADNVIAANTIIQNQLCIGAECVNPETYPAFSATLRLKYQRTRIEAVDTSDPNDAFPSNDWAILFNDDASGGENYFTVSDETAGRRPFTIEAGAPENALRVSASGQIGIGTMLPQANLHIVNTISEPVLRLEDAAGTPYTWDIRGNSYGLYVYDPQTFGIPFEIKSGAPDSAIKVLANGAVGLGTFAPGAALHLRRWDGTAQMLVEEASATTSPRTLLNLQNNGRPELVMGNTDTGGEWSFGAGTNFILKQGAVGSASNAKTKLFEVTATGDATLAGTLTTGGTTCGGGCDRVFTETQIIPAADYAAAMWTQGFLPHVGPTPEGAPLNVSEKLGGMLNALEHAHVFIDRQRGRIEAQNEEISGLRNQLAGLEAGKAAQDARIARLEALVTTLAARR